ncbi:MAG: lamin tail domain-containing protein [Verrucomicrobia bacterium]|nr:lamin tail domain-containing protein [Verrucomicrobiota bacterium]
MRMRFSGLSRAGLWGLFLCIGVIFLGASLKVSASQMVVINEFMASNGSGLKTHQEEAEDWIELYNRSTEAINLSGWYLTDSASEPTRWQFPSGTTIGAGEYLIVFCNSWGGEPLVGGEYFANFSLSKEGEYLALIAPDGQTLIHEFFPTYPPQYTDISYSEAGYHLEPTPGAANSAAYGAPPGVVTFSEPAGYREEPFDVELSSLSPEARIYYTLDGSIPSAVSTLYEAPLKIERITCLRAVAIQEGCIPSAVSTRTWLFPEEILSQSKNPPSGWPVSRTINDQKFEYGMNTAIVSDPRFSEGIRQGMKEIDSISLVTDLGNLFNPETGIYVNAKKDGEEWERPVSVELISPRGGGEFQIDAGLRIRGSSSRSPDAPKHSLRLFFRSRYGDTLQFPLFEGEGTEEFAKMDLRTSQTWAWVGGYPYDTFIRETFSRDSQRDMGMPYTRSRFYHLYINGQYWGLYQTQERSEAIFAQTYLGGNVEDWDCLKTAYPSHGTEAVDGNKDAFRALYQIAVNEGFAGPYATNYFQVKGLNPDGTPNPFCPRYLDEDNLIAYMLITYFTRDPDCPVAMNININNIVCLYNRVNPDGFKWFRHDCEHSMAANRSFPVTYDLTEFGWQINNASGFNPMRLHQRLMDHPDYRMRWIDATQKEMLNPGGALSVEKSLERWNSRQQVLDTAIIMESARWGHGYTRETWLGECNYVKDEFIPKSAEYLIAQMRARGWFPPFDAPVVQKEESEATGMVQVTLRGSASIYYMLDASDPRLPGGAPHPQARILQPQRTGSEPEEWVIEIPVGSFLKARSYDGAGEWSAIAELDTTVYGLPGDLKITELMYAPMVPPEAVKAGWTRDDLAWIELKNTGSGVLELEGFQFVEGITYSFPSYRLPAGERLVLVKNLEAFSCVYDLDGMRVLCGFSGNLARKGEQILLQSPQGEKILDFTYSNEWYPESDQGGYALVVVDTAAEAPLWGTPENWKRGASLKGSPGTADADEEFLPVQIVIQPLSQSVSEGDRVEFRVSALGNAPRTYQWFKDETPLAGSNRSLLVLDSARVRNAGSYRVQVTNPHGVVLSEPAILEVKRIPRMTYQYEGDSLVLNFTGVLYESLDLKTWTKVEGISGSFVLDPNLGTRYYRTAYEE